MEKWSFLESKFAHYSPENTQTAGLWQQKEEKHLIDKVFNHFKHNYKQEFSGYVITEAKTGPDVWELNWREVREDYDIILVLVKNILNLHWEEYE